MRHVTGAITVLLLFVTVAVAQDATVTKNAPIYVQMNPPNTLSPLTVAPVGTVLKVVSEEGQWLQVQFQDPQWGLRTGWVFTEFVAFQRSELRPKAPAVAAPPPAPTTATPPQVNDRALSVQTPPAVSFQSLPPPAARNVSQPDANMQPLSAQAPQAERVTYDFSALYDALNPSIVKVFADSASGSGFLVSQDGLIATNHHVVRNARYLAVQFADGRKVAASVALLDPRYDVAVLRVNPAVVATLKPLHLLAEDREQTVRAGIPVLAFGSPLSQTFLMTQGIVSKVEEYALLGDFLIQPGNSGGPLVTLQGDVIGINTFAVGGISGAVRVRALRNALVREEVVGELQTQPPSPDLLPTLATQRYPTEVLKAKILGAAADTTAYVVDGGKFTITAITPVLVGRLQVRDHMLQAQNRMQRRGKRMNDPSVMEVDAPFYEWTRTATDLLDYAVTFEVKPDFGATAGSTWLTALAAVSAGLSRTPMVAPHQNIEYKAEFQDLKLYRDGVLLRPITPGRSISETSLQNQALTFVDEAYTGYYVYSPSDFMTGTLFKIEVFDAREPGRPHKVITLPADSKLIRQIRADFTDTGQR